MTKQRILRNVIASLLILLPIVAGVIFWDALPEQIATHWGADGQPNGWSSRPFAVFGIPLLLLAVHWLCVGITTRDPRNAGQPPMLMATVFWICPAVSLVANGMIYARAFQLPVSAGKTVMILLCALFLLLGPQMGKCAPNRTVGIRVKWALEDERVWIATHRLASILWTAGGAVVLLSTLLPEAAMTWVALAALLIMATVPIVYAYCLARRLREFE